MLAIEILRWSNDTLDVSVFGTVFGTLVLLLVAALLGPKTDTVKKEKDEEKNG